MNNFEKKKQKIWNEEFKRRNANNILIYNKLDELGKKEMIDKILSDYEDCPEKRKYEIRNTRQKK